MKTARYSRPKNKQKYGSHWRHSALWGSIFITQEEENVLWSTNSVEKNTCNRFDNILQCICLVIWENCPRLMKDIYLDLLHHHVFLPINQLAEKRNRIVRITELEMWAFCLERVSCIQSCSLCWVTVGYWSPYCEMSLSWRLARHLHNSLSAGKLTSSVQDETV